MHYIFKFCSNLLINIYLEKRKLAETFKVANIRAPKSSSSIVSLNFKIKAL